MNLDGTFERFFQGLAFFWPFYVLGVPVGGYNFTISACLFIVLGVLILVRGRFRTRSLVLVSTFMVWALLTVILRYPAKNYLFSWLGLGVMLLPFCGALPQSIRGEKIFRAVYWGAVVSFAFAAYEIAVSLAGLPPLDEVFTFGLWSEVQTAHFLGMQRVKSTMAEPAHYARYLVFVYAILDTAQLYGYHIKHKLLFKVICMLGLVSTLSLSGLILIFVYLGTSAMVRWRRGLQRIFTLRYWSVVTFASPLFVGSLYAADINLFDLFYLFKERIEDVTRAIQLGMFIGSEGSRIQSTLILFNYLGSQDLVHFLTGEGYSQASLWLQEQFGYLRTDLSSFARGDLHNVFSQVGISTGFIGLVIYICIVRNVLINRPWKIPIPIAAVWVVSHFGTGYIIGYQFWVPILLAGLIFRYVERT